MKMNIFFCDIIGTIIPNDKTKFEVELVRLTRNLEKISKIDKLENLIFCLLSGECMEDVLVYANMMGKCLETSTIDIGPHFSSAHMFFKNNKSRCCKGKATQIAYLLESLMQDKNIEIGKVYFADDTELYHALFQMTMKKNYPYIEYESFLLGSEKNKYCKFFHKEKGLESLNELLEKYILEKSQI